MARLTDSTGHLLGGLDTPQPGRLVPPSETMTAAILAPPAVPLPPDYAPREIVFALRCSYGSLAYLTFSDAGEKQVHEGQTRRCPELVEEPDERHYCPACGGSYCAAHAEPAMHDCRSVLQLT